MEGKCLGAKISIIYVHIGLKAQALHGGTPTHFDAPYSILERVPIS